MARVRSRGKPLRVIGGMLMMLGSVAVGLAVLAQFAGGWGVPYFHFTTERGSRCVNTWSGFTCDKLTVAEVEWRTDVALPTGTRVLRGSYESTHDYTIDATLSIPKDQSGRGLSALKNSFGGCTDDHPPPGGMPKLKDVCVMADDLSDADSKDESKSSRLYSVGTGTQSDGTRIAVLSVHSR